MWFGLKLCTFSTSSRINLSIIRLFLCEEMHANVKYHNVWNNVVDFLMKYPFDMLGGKFQRIFIYSLHMHSTAHIIQSPSTICSEKWYDWMQHRTILKGNLTMHNMLFKGTIILLWFVFKVKWHYIDRHRPFEDFLYV